MILLKLLRSLSLVCFIFSAIALFRYGSSLMLSNHPSLDSNFMIILCLTVLGAFGLYICGRLLARNATNNIQPSRVVFVTGICIIVLGILSVIHTLLKGMATLSLFFATGEVTTTLALIIGMFSFPAIIISVGAYMSISNSPSKRLNNPQTHNSVTA